MTRVFRIVERVLGTMGVERQDIGRRGDLYLTRWVLFGTRLDDDPRPKVYLHYFHRSDYEQALHDHPWPFTSLILWPGYFEITVEMLDSFSFGGVTDTLSVRKVSWYGPLSILRRPATWRHAVKLRREPGCWTLVFVGRKERSWFFHCPKGPVPWRRFIARQESGAEGCGE